MPKTDLSLLGPCGIYCGTCDIYVASHTGNQEMQQRIADWIKEHAHLECDTTDVTCGGCWGRLEEHWSADCKILKCAKARGVRLCSSCGEYESCTTLESFYQGGDYGSARETLKRIREVGVEAWAKEREEGGAA